MGRTKPTCGAHADAGHTTLQAAQGSTARPATHLWRARRCRSHNASSRTRFGLWASCCLGFMLLCHFSDYQSGNSPLTDCSLSPSLILLALPPLIGDESSSPCSSFSSCPRPSRPYFAFLQRDTVMSLRANSESLPCSRRLWLTVNLGIVIIAYA